MRLRPLGAWLTWMCLTTRLPVSRPLVSALASAFLRRSERKVADLTGQRALLTPHCLPMNGQLTVLDFSRPPCPIFQFLLKPASPSFSYLIVDHHQSQSKFP